MNRQHTNDKMTYDEGCSEGECRMRINVIPSDHYHEMCAATAMHSCNIVLRVCVCMCVCCVCVCA